VNGDGEADLLEELERLKLQYYNTVDVLTSERAHFDAYTRFLTGDAYVRWIARHTISPAQLERRRRTSLQFAWRPTLSLLMPAAGAPLVQLRHAIESVLAQAYDVWQLIVVVPENDAAMRRVVESFAAAEARIGLVAVQDDGPVAALSAALARAGGDFVGIVDGDGMLAPHALDSFAAELNFRPDLDVVYCDSDRIDDDDRRHDPHFKPEWSPDTLMSRAYVGRLALLRRTLVEAAGGFRSEFEGSHEWELLLRLADRTHRFARLADVLYHVRTPQPVRPASDAAMLAAAMARRGEPGRVETTLHAGTYVVRYALRGTPHVTIIVPTRDGAEDVERALGSLFERSTYPAYDVLLVDNGSTDSVALALFERLAAQEPRLRVIRDDSPFNFSRINNAAAAQAGGEYLIFLNNDTEVIASDWIEALVSQAQRPTVGAVGALLLYPEGRVQHAGVVLGLGGCAGHSHKLYDARDGGYFGALAGVTNYSAVTAACLAVRRDLFMAAGGFDERLAIAYNDTDLCLRLQALGTRNVYVPDARLYHFESRSRGADADAARAKRFEEEKRLLKERWRIGVIDDPYYNPNLTLAAEDFSIDA
jgi:GT2 family glycosyltransferase